MSKRAIVNALMRAVRGGGKRADSVAAPVANGAPAARARPVNVRGNDMAGDVPPLRRHEGSWMVTSPTGEVRELFTEANVRKAVAKGWKAESAGTYLGRINKGIREGSN